MTDEEETPTFNPDEIPCREIGDPRVSEKPKILIVADRPMWAYHYIQRFVVNQLTDRYDFFTDYISYHPSRPPRTLKHRISRRVNWWRNKHLRRVLGATETYDVAVLLGFYFLRNSNLTFRSRCLVKGIYTDGFPPQGVDESDQDICIEKFTEKYLGDATAIVCGSKSIEARFKDLHPCVCYANSSHSMQHFQRQTPKIKNSSKRFIVGWTGKPDRQFKGFHDYVVPAVQQAAQLRPGIELKTRFEGPVETLPRFYDDVDVILIASSADAGPSLFTEGGYCEVPAISTRIGFPSETIQHGHNGLFVERDVEEMSKALVYLYDNREHLLSMSRQVRNDVDRRLGAEVNRMRWLELFSGLTGK